MKEKHCMVCGECNSVEAAMCWSCYTSFTPAEGLKSDLLLPLRVLAHPDQGEPVRSGLAAASGVGLLLSGWLPSRFRIPVLVTSGVTLGAIFAIDCWLTEKRNRQSRKYRDTIGEDEDPTTRICNTILFYALKDGASQIQIVGKSKGVSVLYLVDGAWEEQMVMPRYVFSPLQTHLRLRAGILDQSPQGAFGVTYEGERYRVSLKPALTENGRSILILLDQDEYGTKMGSETDFAG